MHIMKALIWLCLCLGLWRIMKHPKRTKLSGILCPVVCWASACGTLSDLSGEAVLKLADGRDATMLYRSTHALASRLLELATLMPDAFCPSISNLCILVLFCGYARLWMRTGYAIDHRGDDLSQTHVRSHNYMVTIGHIVFTSCSQWLLFISEAKKEVMSSWLKQCSAGKLAAEQQLESSGPEALRKCLGSFRDLDAHSRNEF